MGCSTIDSAGSVGKYSSIAIDSNNKIHISYFDNTDGDGDLKYATNVSGSWVVSAIDSTGWTGTYTSLAIDSNDKVHITYIDDTNYDLKYATNISGSWVTSIVDSSSIEVDRRKRRAKTDRIDAGKLLTMLMRYQGGERLSWRVVSPAFPQGITF